MCDTIARAVVDYHNFSDRFSTSNDDYTSQYFRIYIVRLTQMTNLLAQAIERKWGNTYPICKLYKLSEESYDKCIVIGTLFKDQKLKPSVLKQLSEANQLIPQPVFSHCTDESDVLYLEDELQRYHLEGILETKNLVTGITCAILGSDKGNGKLEVLDYVFADYRPQVERPIVENDTYVVIISGLDLIHIEESILQLKLFCNWIGGVLTDQNDINISQIVRLIIAGNSIKTHLEKMKAQFSMTSRVTQTSETIEAVKVLDRLLWDLCQVIEVDVMPGENDPSNHILPQKSMHHCLFPNSVTYKSLNLVTNPYECQIAGTRFLGTSGQPVTNILKFSDIPEPIEALENTLKWNHLAPTAPDTLGCHPFYNNDPFIIEECPHVLFAGNQNKFDTKIAQGGEGQVVRLICIPEFCTTFTACILNLKNLDCFPITFNAS